MRALVLLVVLASVAQADPCASGDNASCLAQSEEQFGAGQKDVAIVMALGVCEKQDGEGCLRAAYYMDKLHVTTRNGNIGSACVWHAWMIKDEKRAASLWQAACTRGNGAACRFLAASLDANRSWVGVSGDVDDRPKAQRAADEARAAKRTKLWLRGCDLGDRTSCALAFQYAVDGEQRATAKLEALQTSKPCTDVRWEASINR